MAEESPKRHGGGPSWRACHVNERWSIYTEYASCELRRGGAGTGANAGGGLLRHYLARKEPGARHALFGACAGATQSALCSPPGRHEWGEMARDFVNVKHADPENRTTALR